MSERDIDQGRLTRREMIIGLGGAIAGAAAYWIADRNKPNDNLTTEQKEKQMALRSLSTFMGRNTESILVRSFLADASYDAINECFKLGQVGTDYGATLNAWLLRLPREATDANEYEPTITYITHKLNPEFASNSESEQIWVKLNKEGNIRSALKKELHDRPFSYNNFAEDDKIFTFKEMKSAFSRFVPDIEFFDDEGWNVRFMNESGEPTYIQKSFEKDGLTKIGTVLNSGEAHLVVRRAVRIIS